MSEKSYNVPNGSRQSPSKKAAVIALHEMGATKTDIAKAERMSRNTVTAILAQASYKDEKIVARVRKSMAAKWFVTADRALDSITDEKLSKSTAYQLTGIAALSTDKARLSEGMPTQRIEFVGQEDEALQARIALLEGQLAQSDGYKVVQAEQVNP